MEPHPQFRPNHTSELALRPLLDYIPVRRNAPRPPSTPLAARTHPSPVFSRAWSLSLNPLMPRNICGRYPTLLGCIIPCPPCCTNLVSIPEPPSMSQAFRYPCSFADALNSVRVCPSICKARALPQPQLCIYQAYLHLRNA